MESISLENTDVTVNYRLISIINKINLISLCLPEDLQLIVDEVKDNIISVLNGNDISFKETKQLTFLDKVSLYTILNSISKELSICILLNSNNIKFEDSLYYINFIMEKMAEYDSVFRCCFKNGKKRILNRV